jgi:hypothetical protein
MRVRCPFTRFGAPAQRGSSSAPEARPDARPTKRRQHSARLDTQASTEPSKGPSLLVQLDSLCDGVPVEDPVPPLDAVSIQVRRDGPTMDPERDGELVHRRAAFVGRHETLSRILIEPGLRLALPTRTALQLLTAAPCRDRPKAICRFGGVGVSTYQLHSRSRRSMSSRPFSSSKNRVRSEPSAPFAARLSF